MAQGFGYGRYVPPELEGLTTGNKLNSRRAPGTLRPDGSQTVRFEMPFAVWCHGCKPHAIIGQGVRFNAEKRKCGNYYSTPIWSFRMRHVACGTTIEIKTDPKNTAYVVTEGGKARDYGDPDEQVREGENGMPILTAAEREQRREDAFAQLEGTVQEKAQTKGNARRIEELHDTRERDWDDPWTVNKRLRKTFRAERKAIKREEEADQAIKDRIGTDIDLLPLTEEDSTRAKLVSFEAPNSRGDAEASALFRTPLNRVANSKVAKKPKDNRKEALQRMLLKNTRSSLNPFQRRGP